VVFAVHKVALRQDFFEGFGFPLSVVIALAATYSLIILSSTVYSVLK
jgi:hypothetical protein